MPAAVTMRAARLHLNVERPDYQSPLALLLGEAEAAAATRADDVRLANPYGADCNASAKAPAPPSAYSKAKLGKRFRARSLRSNAVGNAV